MEDTKLWKYCTKNQSTDFLLSLGLLNPCEWSRDKQLACLYALSNHPERHYRKAWIPKRNGTDRILYIPDPILLKVQKNINKTILSQFPCSKYASAYHKKASIATNAFGHVGKEKVLLLDLEDFFDHIVFSMIYRQAFLGEYFPPSVRTLLVNLCCYQDRLPQGAPTSPAISNLVMKPFDDYIGEWCAQRHITYTRYSDDMIFSGEFDARAVINKVKSFLLQMGFSINQRKTRVLTETSRQLVTGVVVNEKLQVEREYRKKVRQEIYYCEKYGVKSHLEKKENTAKYCAMGEEGEKRYLLSLLGKINFILQINPQDSYFLEKRKVIKELLKKLGE